MTIRFPIQPRMVPPSKIARRLGITMATFLEKRAELEHSGFPKPDTILGNYCLDAVDQWIDGRAGLSRPGDPLSAQVEMLQAIRGKAWAR
ncbi:hypothetical protein PV773_07115 [Mesorhizobium sp. CC13]|uniref:hypothetical protein n=1 Tax=Mesorhizobium sp. CC13 TaxID=3029194 RepID=UPI003267D38B